MIIFFVKFFSEEKYADAFVRGSLSLQTLRYFKQCENDEARGDPYEGAIEHEIDDQILTLVATNQETGVTDKIVITKEDLAAPITMIPEWFDDVHIFCMYAATINDQNLQTPQDPDHIRRQLEIPQRCITEWKHAVAITNRNEFLRRVRAAADRSGYEVYGGLVQYYDPEFGHGPLKSPMESIFTKRVEFDYQNEYRFALITQGDEKGRMDFDVGDLSDIAFRIDSNVINHSLQVKNASCLPSPGDSSCNTV